MNAMRRFLLGSSAGASNAPSNQTSGSSNTTAPTGPPSSVTNDSHINLGIKPSPSQHAALSLTHLKKLFTDFQKSCHTLSEMEREARLTSMVPLFCRVFATASATEMYEKFPELVSFCHHVSKLLVSEVRRRALDESTEAASFAIAKFLEIENCEETSNGWMLLTALNLLASAGQPVVEEMTSAAIPSTLVKCLYLFFDLPPLQEADINDPDSEFSPRERRILLQKILLQLLVKLCNYNGPAEELARQDDLTLLFSAISSWCPPWNTLWRKSAAETLVTLSRHGLTSPVLSYIHKKGCIGLCVENMQRARDLTPLELMEMFVTVFCLLKDSSELVSTLLDDFRSSQGYIFLAEFLLKTEQDIAGEAQEATRNLVLLLSSLCMCGYSELRPTAAASGTVFQMPGFCVPFPQGAGSSVRNLQAFHILQSVFVKSSSPFLCGAILDAISSIYHSDNANYFILEGQNTLAQLAEKIHTKAPEVQEKFFKLLEFVVFQLNYVPCKELIALSLLLRAQGSASCSIYCMMTLSAILRHHPIYKNVFREVGLLEVFVICLIRFASLLKEKEQDLEDQSNNVPIPELEDKLGFLVMDALGVLLAGCPDNAAIFRESGGARCAHNMVPYAHCRREALGLVQQLILSIGGDDDLGTLLGMMHASPPTALTLKADMLKSLLSCLRESHRARTVFRKVSGFVYVVSILVGLEGALSEEPSSQWTTVPRQHIWSLIHLVLNTLTLAMRYEPANAKFFQQEINDSLRFAIRLLGCFGQAKTLTSLPAPAQEEVFRSIFSEGVQDYEYREHLPAVLQNACLILRLLYDMAIDVYENKAYQPVLTSSSPLRESKQAHPAKKVSTLNLNGPIPELSVVHPGILVSMFQLLPAIQHPEHCAVAVAVQVLLMDVIRNVLRSERNQELLCDAGLPAEFLQVGRIALEDEAHPLHPPLQYAWERLASQALEPKDLREFLRLGSPLNCMSPDSPHFPPPPLPPGYGGPVPLSRVKTLVSMATPRDLCLQGTAALALPPFVEFDMSAEGFGCLLLPSLAPQYPGGPAVVGMGALGGAGDISVIGGIGQGDRVFPPQTGLTYSTWLCVDRFSDPRSDPHCLRLLTVVRQVREDHLICLSVVLSARDKALIVSTQEMALPKGVSDWEPELNGDFGVRIWSPDLIQEGQWHHIALVFNRAVLKNSQFSLYVDGQHTKTCKLHYMSQNPGGGSANLTLASSIYAYIGTSPDWRKRSRLCWRQGPCHLLEEVLTAQSVLLLYRLGPHYLGSLQAPQPPWSYEPLGPLLPEEKVLFGLNAVAMSTLTLSKIRKVYSKADNKQIAKQLGMSTHENATPLCILHNGAGHLNGPARTLGGVVIGYLGVRVFCPKPVSTSLQCVGGCAVLLGLVSMARDVESLYAAVKALVCVVRANTLAQREMERSHGYQTLAFLLRHHRPLLNNHILHLILSLVGTVDSGRENMAVPANVTAFRDLLADLDVWKETPGDLLKTLLEHLHELCTESSEQRSNVRALRELHLVPRLLSALRDRAKLSPPAKIALLNLLGVLLAQQPRSVDLLCMGQFLASTLPSLTSSEICLSLDQDNGEDAELVRVILTRNDGLQLILQLVQSSKTANTSFGEELVRVLGFDWLLLFLQGHTHPTSVTCALRMLVSLLCAPALLLRFKEGAPGCMGGWLRPTELVPQGHRGILLGFQLAAVSNQAGVSNANVKREEGANCFPGFQVLQQLLPAHCQNNSVYFLLMALLWAQPLQKTPQVDTILDLDNVWACLGTGPQPVIRNVSCTEAITTVLHMVKALLHQELKKPEDTPEWLKNHPVTLVQFLFYVYQNCGDPSVHFMNPELLGALVAPLFPPEASSECSSPLEDSHAPWESVLVPMSTVGKDQMLLTHPVTKFIFDFLRVLVVDALALAPSTKSVPIIDLVLEAGPETASHAQLAHYQTEILSALMEHLLAADILMGDSAHQSSAQAQSQHQQQQYIAANVFYVAGRLVDKLWQGYCLKPPKEVLDFLVKLLSQAKRRSTVFVSLESLYRCLNRTVLYLLSRPMDSIAEQMGVLETLHKLTHNRSLIFGAGNHDLEFLGGLTYCLVHLAAGMKIVNDSNNKTTWHVSPDASTNANTLSTDATWEQGHNLVASAARRVWEELYISKKPAIEEVFKISLGTNKAPSLEMVKDQLRDAATKVWLTYVDGEKRCVYRAAYESQNQIASKIQKVTGGLTRLASRTKARREETLNKNRLLTFLSLSDLTQLTQSQLCGIREMVDSQWRQFALAQWYAHQYLREEWKVTERELLRERGVWGPLQGSALDKWMLDMTEGPSRMRKKVVRNLAFYAHYPYRAELELAENRQLKYKVATSLDSKEHHRFFAQWKPNLGVAGADNSTDSSLSDNPQSLLVLSTPPTQADSAKVVEDALRDLRTFAQFAPALKPGVERSISELEDENETELGDSVDEKHTKDGLEKKMSAQPACAEESPAHQTLLRYLEEGERITHMFRCARVQGLDTAEGLLLFGREHLYVVDGFTLLRTREIKEISSLTQEQYDPIIPPCTAPGAATTPTHTLSTTSRRNCSQFSYEDIREVHKRRYLLQPIALEVFSQDGRNHLLVFPRGIRHKVYQRLLATATSLADSAQLSVAGQRRSAHVETSGGLFSSLMGETSVTQRWVRGEISNFQYLMHLNTLAGRSYNDLMQYPVFPWILADYDSTELDLTSPATFRDLSKPMGAQTPGRLVQFQKRYKEWDDPHSDTPPYHYGTHYSSAMIVCSYLIRLEPFAQHFLHLQGGHFDLADRMFHSVREAWFSAAKHNMADVKELIPEFFYLPEFLVNNNKFDLGVKQSGVALHDALLPPWAKEDPREFIRIHRMALECDYVSQHLHEWIDLIFGCKQQGPLAVEAVNVFHHLFYEGNVDIYAIQDPLQRTATIGFINNFGQIPKQLFKKAHPAKKARDYALFADKLFFHHLDHLKPSLTPVRELKRPVGHMVCAERNVLLAVEENKVLLPPNHARALAWGFADHSLRLVNYDSDKAILVCEAPHQGEILAAVAPFPKMVLTGGTSTVVTVWEVGKKTLTWKQQLFGHREAVTCLCASPAYGLAVSGSRDRTAIVWDLSSMTFLRELPGHSAALTAVSINCLTGDIATCAGTWLHLWSINGTSLACVNTLVGQGRRTDRLHHILCVEFSVLNEWDAANVVITGATDGVVRMWSLDYVQIPDQDGSSSGTAEEKGNTPVEAPSARDSESETAAALNLSASLEVEKLEESESSAEEEEEEREDLGEKEDIETLLDQSGDQDEVDKLVQDKPVLVRQRSLTSLTDLEEVSFPQPPLRRKRAGQRRALCKSEFFPSEFTLPTADESAEEKSVLRSSKSDTSINDSFGVITESETSQTNSENLHHLLTSKPAERLTLREGFHWQRQIIFRSKLTMHTAYDRQDNVEPASVTAVAIAKDHRTLYIGDARGRIFSWNVAEQPGKGVADHWLREDLVETCLACQTKFTLTERRHHCRNCGHVFCSRCSSYESEITRLRIVRSVRVCHSCYTHLRSQATPP